MHPEVGNILEWPLLKCGNVQMKGIDLATCRNASLEDNPMGSAVARPPTLNFPVISASKSKKLHKIIIFIILYRNIERIFIQHMNKSCNDWDMWLQCESM